MGLIAEQNSGPALQEEKVPQEDVSLPKSSLMVEKVVAGALQKEPHVLPEEGSAESSPEFGEKMINVERSDLVFPSRLQNLGHVASDDGYTTCDEQDTDEKEESVLQISGKAQKLVEGLKSSAKIESKDKDAERAESDLRELALIQQREKSKSAVMSSGTEEL